MGLGALDRAKEWKFHNLYNGNEGLLFQIVWTEEKRRVRGKSYWFSIPKWLLLESM